jgi:hypothetical protein
MAVILAVDAELKRLRRAIAVTPKELSKNCSITLAQAINALGKIRRRAGMEGIK